MSARTSRLVFRNHWDELDVPHLGQWTPELRVSVIIPARNCQGTLELTLASLRFQTYPGALLEVVVVDDGSDPPLELPKIRPQNSRMVRVAESGSGWGRANALHTGAETSTGDILHWLDADMVAFPQHIEAQARWHHVVPYGVALGYKRFVRDGWLTPAEAAERCAEGTIDGCFALEDTEPHDYVEELIRRSHQLRRGDHLAFRAHVGATASVRRFLYTAAGGFNTELRLGEDTEFGFRLMQAGALFVPEPASKSWHMGRSHMMTRGESLRRYNWPILADHMPHPRWLRNVDGRSWAVPLVTAVVEVQPGSPFEIVRTCVDHLLAGEEHDLKVLIVGRWSSLTEERHQILDDPLLDLRLIAANYRSEPRVSLVERAPDTVFPSPFRLDVPIDVAVGPGTVRRLVEEADAWQVGIVRTPVREEPSATVTLWRTAAVHRARFDHRADKSLSAVIAETHGERQVRAGRSELTYLSAIPPVDMRSPRPGWAARSAGRYQADGAVLVAGVRSLLRAAAFVARTFLGRTGHFLRVRVRTRILPPRQERD